MNQENAKILLPVIIAFAEGRQVEFRGRLDETWHVAKDLDFSADPKQYRIKPEPTLRPWTPEEVPVGALARQKDRPSERRVILSNAGGTVQFGEMHYNSPGGALDDLEVSTDGGKTWGPCGVPDLNPPAPVSLKEI